MQISCEEYRNFQLLLALRKRLAENNLSPEEREEILQIVEALEKQLDM